MRARGGDGRRADEGDPGRGVEPRRGEPRAAFFCESCGHPVRLKDAVCPHCGRWFSAARCPRCGFVGEPVLFGDGCPRCGYLQGGEERRADGGRSKRPRGRSAPRQESDSKERGGGSLGGGKGLPPWGYAAAVVLLLAALLVFIIIIVRSPGS